MEQRNCKNCGAQIEHSYNHRCPYCNTLFDFNEPDKIEVKPEDLVNIELRYIERMPINDSLILMFSGYKCPMPKVYEYNSDNLYVSKVEQYINPPKCSMCIEIPIYEIEKYGIEYVYHKICSSGIRYNEIDKVMAQVRENKEIRYYCG